ncbi:MULTISPECIES: hypothetical protein [Pseudomonas]|uniref:hypothetical protein n=1 Tax=Pseudomonas nitroreducens TaxID=46680 RepID=UPI00147ED3D7|nr:MULTISPECIES: hypothetical protein [Pseudomonas]NNN28594.1 hypothetical protein [Pseudomonas nitroreducens]
MEQNPYAAPQVELVDTRAPTPFLVGDWSSGKLRLLAGLTLALLLTDLTLIGIGMVARLPGGPKFLMPYEEWLGALSMLLGCFLAWRSTRLLEDRFAARGLRWPMWILIVIAVVMQVFSMLFDVDLTGSRQSNATVYFMMMYLPSGLVQLWYGIRVLKIQLPFTSVKVMGWFDVVSGICLASIVLFAFGTLLSIINTIPLALIFLRSAGEQERAAR